jgi:hypothetical protein
MAVTTKIAVFWVRTPYTLIYRYKITKENAVIMFRIRFTLKTEAILTHKILEPISQISRRRSWGDSNLQVI